LNILKPVSITMILVICAVRLIHLEANPEVNSVILYTFQEDANTPTGSKIWHALVSAAIFVVMIVFTTFVFVFLYKYRCLKVIFGWLLGSTGILLGMFGGTLLYFILTAQNWPMDYITFSFLVWNFAAVGIIAIFYHVPPKLNQAYLICISALMAIFFTQLPEWTTWMILGAIAIYDIFAVLCPGGPLKMLVETAQERQEPIPALLYNASAVITMAQNESEQPETQPEAQQALPIERRGGVKLGLGDFVFYSVLIGRAAMYDMLSVFTCFVAIVMGLFATLILLVIFQQALPALPISIFLGILFFFLSKVFLLGYVYLLGANSVFV